MPHALFIWLRHACRSILAPLFRTFSGKDSFSHSSLSSCLDWLQFAAKHSSRLPVLSALFCFVYITPDSPRPSPPQFDHALEYRPLMVSHVGVCASLSFLPRDNPIFFSRLARPRAMVFQPSHLFPLDPGSFSLVSPLGPRPKCY